MCVDPFFFSTTRSNRERSGHTRSCYIRQATYPRKGRTMDRNVFAFVIFFFLSLPLSYHVMLWLIGRHVYDYDSGIRPILFFLRHPLCGVSSHLRVVPDTGNDVQMRKINEWIRGFLAVGVIFCSVYTLWVASCNRCISGPDFRYFLHAKRMYMYTSKPQSEWKTSDTATQTQILFFAEAESEFLRG